jgi:DNA-binding MarR family transcriptional regulator
MDNDFNRRLDTILQAKWTSRQVLLRKLLKETAPSEPGGRGTHPHRGRGFTPEQFVIIRILHSFGHGVTVGEITEAIEIPHSNVTRTLDRLEKKGLIRRRRGEEDKRQMIVRLTLEGNKAARLMNQVQRELNERLWAGCDDDEKRQLILLLSK